jgi:hypothetical protein
MLEAGLSGAGRRLNRLIDFLPALTLSAFLPVGRFLGLQGFFAVLMRVVNFDEKYHEGCGKMELYAFAKWQGLRVTHFSRY